MDAGACGSSSGRVPSDNHPLRSSWAAVCTSLRSGSWRADVTLWPMLPAAFGQSLNIWRLAHVLDSLPESLRLHAGGHEGAAAGEPADSARDTLAGAADQRWNHHPRKLFPHGTDTVLTALTRPHWSCSWTCEGRSRYRTMIPNRLKGPELPRCRQAWAHSRLWLNQCRPRSNPV